MIIGIKRAGETMMMPEANTVVQKGDVLWVVGAESNIESLMELGGLE